MSESTLSQEFIKNSKKELGKKLYIRKVITQEIGVPDIEAVFEGMSLFAESKLINEISLINNHKFKLIQKEQLEERAKAGSFCIGLLLLKNDIRYIMWNEIPDNGYITKEQFLSAERFEWQNVKSRWLKMVNF